MHSLDMMCSRFILCLLEYDIWTNTWVSLSTIQTLKVIILQDLAIWLDFVAQKVSRLYASYQNEMKMCTLLSHLEIFMKPVKLIVMITYTVQLVA